MYKKTSFLISFAAVILLVGAGCGNRDTAGSPASQADGTANPATTVETATTTAPATTTPTAKTTATKTITAVKKPTTSAGSAPKSYTDALAIYRTSGYYFQFVKCSGNPGSLIVKKGKKYMLDNRDAVSHRFVVGGRAYTIGGYGYLILTADRVGTHNVTCDGGGSATVKVLP